jgi:hypothetical protein
MEKNDKGEGPLYLILVASFIGLFISIIINYVAGVIGWGFMLLSCTLFLVGIEIGKLSDAQK